MTKKNLIKGEMIVYQAKNGAIELRGDFSSATMWATLQQIADLFETDKSGISRHINRIYKEKELDESSTVAKNATVQKEGNRSVVRSLEFYNLDVILSVGYRVNSKNATIFRKWATDVLRQHITEGYTINKTIIAKNYDKFIKAVDEVKLLLPDSERIGAGDAIELIRLFAGTWLALDAYDKSNLPEAGTTKRQVLMTVENLLKVFNEFKDELSARKEAGDLFGAEPFALYPYLD